jgi:hypothetical protein
MLFAPQRRQCRQRSMEPLWRTRRSTDPAPTVPPTAPPQRPQPHSTSHLQRGAPLDAHVGHRQTLFWLLTTAPHPHGGPAGAETCTPPTAPRQQRGTDPAPTVPPKAALSLPNRTSHLSGAPSNAHVGRRRPLGGRSHTRASTREGGDGGRAQAGPGVSPFQRCGRHRSGMPSARTRGTDPTPTVPPPGLRSH